MANDTKSPSLEEHIAFLKDELGRCDERAALRQRALEDYVAQTGAGVKPYGEEEHVALTQGVELAGQARGRVQSILDAALRQQQEQARQNQRQALEASVTALQKQALREVEALQKLAEEWNRVVTTFSELRALQGEYEQRLFPDYAVLWQAVGERCPSHQHAQMNDQATWALPPTARGAVDTVALARWISTRQFLGGVAGSGREILHLQVGDFLTGAGQSGQ